MIMLTASMPLFLILYISSGPILIAIGQPHVSFLPTRYVVLLYAHTRGMTRKVISSFLFLFDCCAGQSAETAQGAAAYLVRLTPGLWFLGMAECFKRSLTSRVRANSVAMSIAFNLICQQSCRLS
jgi:hypothetical protein